jgi:hypothetical protein
MKSQITNYKPQTNPSEMQDVKIKVQNDRAKVKSFVPIKSGLAFDF